MHLNLRLLIVTFWFTWMQIFPSAGVCEACTPEMPNVALMSEIVARRSLNFIRLLNSQATLIM